MSEALDKMFDRVETIATQRSRHPAESDYAKDVLAVSRIARAATKITTHVDAAGWGVALTEQFVLDADELVAAVRAAEPVPDE
jgi:hypothetical protein